MSYFDCLAVAVHHVQDFDLPADLLPLVIANEAALLSGHEAGHLGHASWD